MQKALEKNHMARYSRMKRAYDSLDEDFICDLKLFMKFDDLGKMNFFETKGNI